MVRRFLGGELIPQALRKLHAARDTTRDDQIGADAKQRESTYPERVFVATDGRVVEQ